MQKILESPITQLILCVIFFLPICIILFSGNSFFSVNDDVAVMSLLKSGEPHVLIMSYPLSVVLVLLYKEMPVVPWYSILITSTLILSSIIYFKTLKALFNKNIYFYLIFFSIGLIFYSYATKNISITIVTILCFATSFLILLFKNKLKIFLFSISICLSFLLREFYIILTIFYIILIFIILIDKKLFKIKNYLNIKEYIWCLLPITIILLNNYGYSSPEYKEWVNFNSARAKQSDFYQFIPEGNKFINQENLGIFRLWYPYDQEVIPTEVIIKISGTTLELYKNAFKAINKKEFFKNKIKFYYKYIIFIFIILTLILLKLKKNKIKSISIFMVSNAVLIGLVFALIFIRDVERVTLGLFFIIFCYNLIFVYDYCHSDSCGDFNKKYTFVIFVILFLSIAVVWGSAFRNTLLNYDTKTNFKKEILEYNEFRNGYEEYNFIPCILLPYFMCNFFVVQNFYEDDSIGNFTNQNFIPGGWLARSPFYYKKLHEKGFNSFYDFLMDEKTLFFGSKIISTEYNEKYLNYLDANFGNNEYKHSIETVKINDLFSFSKIIRVKK